MKDATAIINGRLESQLLGPLDCLKWQFRIGLPAPLVGVTIIAAAVAVYADPLLWIEWLVLGLALSLWFVISLMNMTSEPSQILTPHTISCGAAAVQVVVFERHGRTEILNVTRRLGVVLPAGVVVKRTPAKASSLWLDWRFILKDRFEPIRH